MRYHIPVETAETVRRLATQNWSQRRIAAHLNLSVTTVHRVLKQRWSPSFNSDDPYWELKLKAKRCTGCGGLVYEWPCRTCHMRATVERDRQLRAA